MCSQQEDPGGAVPAVKGVASSCRVWGKQGRQSHRMLRSALKRRKQAAAKAVDCLYWRKWQGGEDLQRKTSQMFPVAF